MKLLDDFLFIIPARKGSKGIKNKNIIKIRNKSLVEYTFQILRKISSNKKYVLTDSKKIKSIAKKYNINTDYIRTSNLSKDSTELIENLCHFDHFVEQKLKFTHYVILQPTSPLRTYDDLLQSIKKYIKDKSESLFSISPSLEHPNESVFFRKKKMFYFKKNKKQLRQKYKKSFFINGAIYIFNRKLLKNKTMISNKNHSTFTMPKKHSIDIDDNQDLEIIKKLL